MDNTNDTNQENFLDNDDQLSFLSFCDPRNEVVFCGEIIPPKQKNEFLRHPENGLFIRRESFKRSRSFVVSAAVPAVNSKVRSKSVRFGQFVGSPAATGKSSFRSSSSRKHKVFVGLVMKLQPKMELSEIRKRQHSRKTIPVPMFPVKELNEPAAKAFDKVVGTKSSSTDWGLFRPLRCSAHLLSALTKASFGCIPYCHVCK